MAGVAGAWRRWRSERCSGRTSWPTAARSRDRSAQGYGPYGSPTPTASRARRLHRPSRGARRGARARQRLRLARAPRTARPRSPPTTAAGSWCSNSEEQRGGAAAMRFGRDGEIARRLPDPRRHHPELRGRVARRGPPGSRARRSEDGRVWECDPTGRRKARVHDAMGVFKHEAAAVDPRGRRVVPDRGPDRRRRSYRFTPRALARP